MIDRPRIAVSTHLFPSSSTILSGPWVAEQVDALAAHADITVLAALRDCTPSDEVRPSGVHVSYRPTRILPGAGRAALLSSFLRYHQVALKYFSTMSPHPELIHAHFGFPDAVVVARVARKLEIPWVATLHGDDAFSLLGRSDPLGSMMRSALSTASTILCVSKAMAEVVCRDLRGFSSIKVIPNGYDGSLFSISTNEREGFLFVGTLTAVKNIDLLLHAYSQLDKPPRLTIAGEGVQELELRTLTSQLDIEGSVTFAGVQGRDDVAALMKRAQALIIPSSSEGFGLVAAESLACGTPVVASRVGGLPEILAGAHSGILVEPNSIDALVLGLRQVLGCTWNPALVAAGSGALPWGHRAAEIAQIYSETLKGGH